MAVYVNTKTAGVGFAGVGREIVTDMTLSAGANSATEQIIKQFLIPAGTLTSVSWFKVNVLWTKTGTTDSMTLRLRFGPLGTIADPSLLSTTIAAGGRTSQTSTSFLATSATELQILNGSGLLAFEGGPSGAAIYPTNTTVSNMATGNNFLSLIMLPSGTTDTPQIPRAIITVY